MQKKSKAIPVTGCGGLNGCEVLRIPHCLDSWLTDGSEVASLTHQPLCTSQKHFLFVSGIHFSYRLSKPKGLEWLEGLDKVIFNYLIGSQTCKLPDCNTMLQPQCYCTVKALQRNILHPTGRLKNIMKLSIILTL
jgi:hypothetical protein